MSALLDYVLAHGWDDEDVAALEQALTAGTNEGLEEALAILGERQCSPTEYCEIVALLRDLSVRYAPEAAARVL
jgi:hypothetical protein